MSTQSYCYVIHELRESDVLVLRGIVMAEGMVTKMAVLAKTGSDRFKVEIVVLSPETMDQIHKLFTRQTRRVLEALPYGGGK